MAKRTTRTTRNKTKTKNKARNPRAAKAARNTTPAKSGTRGARRGNAAAKPRSSATTRKPLLAGRAARQARFDAGELPAFLPQTRHVRDDTWKIAPIPNDLLDRRVEITGPVDRKMIINALNSGANVYMADFEDANSPTWANSIEGQLNPKDRWAGRLAFIDAATGKNYAIGKNPAVLIVRPRGWHLPERHLTIDGEPIAGALFALGRYYFHDAQ